MKNYNLILEYSEGDFSVDIILSEVILAQCETQALNKAKELTDLICMDTNIFYDFKKNSLEIQQGLTLDRSLTLALLSPKIVYKYYDRTLGDDISLTMEDGTILYPVINSDSIITIEKEQWQEKINFDYTDYRVIKNRDYIFFECISFGISSLQI